MTAAKSSASQRICHIQNCTNPVDGRRSCKFHKSNCAVVGCERPKGRGKYCGKHSNMASQVGHEATMRDFVTCRADHCATPAKFSKTQLCAYHYKICSIPGCEKPRQAQDYCTTHLSRLRIHGDPLKTTHTQKGEPLAHAMKIASGEISSTSCIDWPYRIDLHGYGTVYLPNNTPRSMKAHRVILGLSLGMTLDEIKNHPLQTLHKCPNGSRRCCVNPAHLAFGSVQENSDDRVLEGRSMRGSLHPRAVLSDDIVRMIRKDKRPSHVVASELGVGTSTVDHARTRRTWSHID